MKNSFGALERMIPRDAPVEWLSICLFDLLFVFGRAAEKTTDLPGRGFLEKKSSRPETVSPLAR